MKFQTVKIGNRKLTDSQYRDWLKLAKLRISEGLPLIAYDDDYIGDKDLYCSWGMCGNDVEAWPSVETWLHRENTFVLNGRVDIIIWDEKQYCPFDSRRTNDYTDFRAKSGCFYSCRIFQDGLKDRKIAIRLIDQILNE